MDNKELGIMGEDAVVEYVIKKGGKILERNWRKGRSEVDLIFEIDDFIVFAEVKTRATRAYGDPVDFVSYHQQRRIMNAAHIYIHGCDTDLEARFDIFGVVINKYVKQVEHFEEAFYPIA